jgi:hypothetical protein
LEPVEGAIKTAVDRRRADQKTRKKEKDKGPKSVREDLRKIKVQQKISGNFRSWEGAAIFCRIRGYVSTVKKNFSSVIDAIQGAFEGNPFIPKRTLIAV